MEVIGVQLKKIFITSNTAWFLYNFRSSLLKNLIKNGYVVYFCSPYDKYVDLLIQMGCSYEYINISRFGKNLFYEVKSLLSYIKILNRIKPDLVLGFTIKPVIYVGIACIILNIKYINTITGLGSSFLSGGLLKYFIKYLYIISQFGAQKILFINKYDADYFNQNRIINSSQQYLLNGEGVDLEKFKYTEYCHTGVLKFLFIGRLISHKGILEYISAAKSVGKKNKNVVFQILGPFDFGNKSCLVYSDIAKLKDDNIQYLGETTDVAPYIINSTCVVLPSYREGSPKSLLEAAAIGRPIITTDTPGCNEIVLNGYNGYLCQPKDYTDLVRCMEIVIRLNISQIVNLGHNGRCLVEDKFSDKNLNLKYLDLVKYYI